ncbi:tRNA lysidine(34) synthetase TilS [bacterium]|nr:tRNA lysidine(34) synthetase TilS [bacterium]
MTDLPASLLAGLHQTAALGLAVSGGGDSIALLHLAVAAGLQPSVVTVDHGLRPEAAAEAEAVGRIAARLGLPHQVLRWQGTTHAGNLQDAARRARRRLMAEWAVGQGLSSLVLAHTRDDVAETFLMRLARGAGVDGLAAMASFWTEGGILWQRPMLGMGRQELRNWLQARNLTWVEDPSNENPRFDRVRMRKALASGALGLRGDRLAEVAAHLAEARAALDALADDWSARTLTEEAGSLRIAPDFWRAPVETRRRLIQRVVLWIAPSDYAPRGAQISQLLDRLSQGHAATLAGCRFLPAEGEALRALREARAAQAPVPGPVWDGRWKILGPWPEGAEIGPLGALGLAQVAGWRATGLPRPVLLVSPALWRGGRLIAAPLAGFAADAYSAIPLYPWIGRKNTTLSH